MKKKRIIIVIFIIIWAIIVSIFSNQGSIESTNSSISTTGLFVKDEELVELIEPYIRKVAHLTEYAIGGLLFGWFFSTYDLKDEKIILFSIAIGAWYAMFDEIHQHMIPGRTGRPVDVYIDSIGVAIGVVFFLIIRKIVYMKENKKENKK